MTRNKKGFTLVELVIVIAVIAILAGVMIAVFSGVVKRANESAELQKLKNEELAQKADDVIKKIDNANWFSWEDFENSLAAKMTEVYKANTANSETTSIDDIKVAVKAALKEYTESNATQNTQLTEAQVKAIVENALADTKLGGVTETQVRTIVNTAVAGIQSPLTKTQVQAIVDAAVAKGLTAAQVAQVIGEQGLATSAQIQTVIATLNTISTNALSKEDVEDALLKLLPVTYSVSNQTELEAALAKVNSFSTLSFTSDFAATITLGASDTRTLTLTGVKLTSLTVNAPVATIYLVTDAGTVKVNSVAQQSFHVSGKVDSLTIGQGRAVVEEGGEVTSLTAAPAENQVVKVEIAQAAKVETLTVELQKNTTATAVANETVEIANAGTVGTTTVVAEEGTNAISTNVVISGYTAAEVKEVADATTTAGATILDTDAAVEYTTQAGTTAASTQENVDTTVKLQGSGTEADPYLVRTVEELKLVAANVNGGETGKYYKLTADLDISDTTWTPIGDKETNQFVGTFDGGKHTITGLNNRASFEYVGTEVITITSGLKVEVYGLFGWMKGTSTVKDLTMADVNISTAKGSGVGAVVGYAGTAANGANLTFTNITVTGKITALDNAAGVAGRCLYGASSNSTVTFTGCTNEATVKVTRTDKYARAGGIAAYLQSVPSNTFVFTECTNTATITGMSQQGSTDQWVGQIYGYESYDTTYNTHATITVTSCTESGAAIDVNAVA